jgi:glucose-6-phosphate 1-dehydrogenase
MDQSSSTTFVIIGATSDLSTRKLLPSLFNLYTKGRLDHPFRIVGFSRRDWDNEDLRWFVRKSLEEAADAPRNDSDLKAFLKLVYHIKGELREKEAYSRMAERLGTIEGGPSNRLYYFAIPPRFFADVAGRLGEADLVRQDEGWRRVVIEKPFGEDLASAQRLNHALHQVLHEEQIYRIDHYLGKETVQNMLVFRFANTIFEPIWNRNYIDHIQITVAESLGVGRRAGYYDRVGVLKDMFQNHLLQLLTLVTMEPPAAFSADALRNEKTKVLRSVRPVAGEQVEQNSVRAQYRGYLEEPDVRENSTTATYATLRLFIDNWRWQGVPFYLRSGKSLAEKKSEILVQFKCPPHLMFPLPLDYRMTPNFIAICIQPDEGIHLRFEAKVPDTVADTRSVDMEFHYAQAFGGSEIPDAYDRLLLDALKGDASLFTRGDEIELAWGLIDSIHAGWVDKGKPALASYTPGSWGPAEADEFLARDDRRWISGCGGHEETE